jgi:polyhydroxybutyrate depolymerase
MFQQTYQSRPLSSLSFTGRAWTERACEYLLVMSSIAWPISTDL